MTKPLNQNKQLSRPGSGWVPADVPRELLRLVGEFGDDPHGLLRDARLLHLAPLLLDGGDGRDVIPQHTFTPIYAAAIGRLDVQAARQEGRDSLTKAGVDMMCHCIITCRTLRDAIARMDQFSALLAPRTGRLMLVESGEVARLDMLTVRRVRNACSYLSDLTGLAAYHRLLGWLIGEDIPLSGAALRYPPLLTQQTVAYLMPHAVQHHAPENSLRFPARYLDRPVVRTHHELDFLLQGFPFDLAASQSKETPLSERLSHLFAAMLASGDPPATASHLAQQFSLSVATLKRRLAAEGVSLSQLKAGARRDLAMQLLRDPRISISEVGRRTQFSDAGAFRRAFRHWTGQSPSGWRQGAPERP